MHPLSDIFELASRYDDDELREKYPNHRYLIHFLIAIEAVGAQQVVTPTFDGYQLVIDSKPHIKYDVKQWRNDVDEPAAHVIYKALVELGPDQITFDTGKWSEKRRYIRIEVDWDSIDGGRGYIYLYYEPDPKAIAEFTPNPKLTQQQSSKE